MGNFESQFEGLILWVFSFYRFNYLFYGILIVFIFFIKICKIIFFFLYNYIILKCIKVCNYIEIREFLFILFIIF